MNDDASAWVDRVRAAWDKRADRWDATAEADRTAPGREAEIERTISALGLKPGSHLLDAGCGTGQWALAFAQRGIRVTAVDASPAMIARAREHEAANPGQIPVEWRVGDLSRAPEPFAIYHAIHCRAALHFLPDLPGALKEFRRILRPGGRLLASVPGALSPIYRASWERHLHTEPPEVNWLTPWELENLLLEFGWRIVDGWGDYGRDLTGTENPFDPEALAALDRSLQQAAATMWNVIAA
jgi:SAM-dependent methyltransferase